MTTVTEGWHAYSFEIMHDLSWNLTIQFSRDYFYFNPPFFSLKMSCTKSGKWPLLYHSSFLCCVTFLRCVSVVLFVFSYIGVGIHITIRRVTVLFYPKFMYLVLMLYLLFSLVRFCVCYILMLCRCSPLIFNAFPSVLVCYPDFVFCP